MHIPWLAGRRGLFGLVVLWQFLAGVAVPAADAPPPPASPLTSLVRKLAEKRAGEKASAGAVPRKEDLLRPEFRFKRAPGWLTLPDLARQLTTTEDERTAIMELLDKGVTEASRLFAAEGADNDVGAAAAFFLTQLWSHARQQEIPEPGSDQLHAQLVAALAGPEMAKLSDADKQRFWEYCIGFPVFVLGMKEVATEPAAQADLRTIAGAGFKSVLGVPPELVDIGTGGIALSAAAEAELAKMNAGSAPAPTVVRANAPAPAATVVRAPAPAAEPTAVAAGVSGITYTPPTGWAREDAAWATIFRATLFDTTDKGVPEPHRDGRHAGSIFVLPPRPMTGDAHTTFDALWRQQFDGFNLGDTVVHYRSRLPCGLVVHYMGRFFKRKNAAANALDEYGVLYLVDLGAGRVQPITAIAVPNDPGLGMATFKETAAYRSLAWPLGALLDSIKPVGGPAPYPSGGYFAASDLQGNWEQSSSAFGGMYVNTVTGMGAGAAVSSSSGTFRLGTDWTYEYSFGYANFNPQFGSSSGSTKHGGRYRLDGDIVLVEPAKPISYKFTCCAVGKGTRQTPGGLKRILVTVSATGDGAFRAPPMIPNWDSYSGTMNWYSEK